MFFWCLISSKKEWKQVDLRSHNSKVEFVHSIFGGNVGLKNNFYSVWPLVRPKKMGYFFKFSWLSQIIWVLNWKLQISNDSWIIFKSCFKGSLFAEGIAKFCYLVPSPKKLTKSLSSDFSLSVGLLKIKLSFKFWVLYQLQNTFTHWYLENWSDSWNYS